MQFIKVYLYCVGLVTALCAVTPASVCAMQHDMNFRTLLEQQQQAFRDFQANNLQALLADQKKAHTDLLIQLFDCKCPADLTKSF